MMQATFEMGGKVYTADAETLEVLCSIIPSAKATGDLSAVGAVMILGLEAGRIVEMGAAA